MFLLLSLFHYCFLKCPVDFLCDRTYIFIIYVLSFWIFRWNIESSTFLKDLKKTPFQTPFQYGNALNTASTMADSTLGTRAPQANGQQLTGQCNNVTATSVWRSSVQVHVFQILLLLFIFIFDVVIFSVAIITSDFLIGIKISTDHKFTTCRWCWPSQWHYCGSWTASSELCWQRFL